MRIPGFELAPKKPELNEEERRWVAETVKHLETHNTDRLVGRDIFPNESAAQMAENLLRLAPIAGYESLLIKQLILRQLFFAALVMGGDTFGIADWAKKDLQMKEVEVGLVLGQAKAHLPTKAPAFVSEAPKSIQKAGETMAEVWRGFKVPVEFVSGAESGLRHYSLRFKLPTTTSVNRVEANLRDALSHGGFHPGIRVVFTFLLYGEFEIHIPKEKDDCKAMSFTEYLWQLLGCPPWSEDDPRALENLVRATTNRFYPKASLLKPPEIPIGIDIHGKIASVHYGSGGIIVGSPDSGKSTHLKLTLILLMLTLPPEMFKFTAIDLKDVTFERFTAGWRNPWTLATVITSKNCHNLDNLFESLKAEKQARVKRMSKFKCENWLKHNAKNPANQIPFSPIFLDEGSKLQDAMGKAKADAWIQEISSSWRFVGMPLIVGAQYATDQHSLPPAVRQNLRTTIAFQASERGAKNAFDDDETVRAVQQLLGGGDFVARSAGSLIPVHGQGFDAPEDTIDEVLEVLKSMYAEAPESSYLYFPDAVEKSYSESDDVTDDLWEGGRPDCPRCGSVVTRNGSKNGGQQYKCSDKECNHAFVL